MDPPSDPQIPMCKKKGEEQTDNMGRNTLKIVISRNDMGWKIVQQDQNLAADLFQGLKP